MFRASSIPGKGIFGYIAHGSVIQVSTIVNEQLYTYLPRSSGSTRGGRASQEPGVRLDLFNSSVDFHRINPHIQDAPYAIIDGLRS